MTVEYQLLPIFSDQHTQKIKTFLSTWHMSDEAN